MRLMKPSEAILLGSIGTGQAFNVLVDKQGNTCAMGAAYVAVGIITVEHPIEDFSRGKAREMFKGIGWEWLLDKRVNCPVCKVYRYKAVTYVVAHLNDEHKWTRPQIAEWVKAIEPKDNITESTSTHLLEVEEQMVK